MEVLCDGSGQRRCEHSVIDSASHEKPFAIFGLSGSISMSFLAARIVAANRMGTFFPQSLKSSQFEIVASRGGEPSVLQVSST